MESLEQRSLLSLTPAPFPQFVGPMPMMYNPQTEWVPPGSGPTTELHAGTHTTPGTVSYSFRVTYRDDVAVRVSSIDSFDIYVYGPNGYVRRAIFMSMDRTADAPVVTARYKIAPPAGEWDGSDNGRYTVWLQPNQVFDASGNAANSGLVGDFSVLLPGVGGPPGVRTAVDVRDFGAIPNDGIDDSDAIEAAINSLPLGNGSPTGTSPAGGIVQFPVGIFDIRRSIKLPSGVTLRGSGVQTVIHDISTDRNHAAILLYSPYTHRWNIGAAVEDLSIYTRWGGGIWVDPNMGGSVVDLRLANLRVSSLGTAIDLRNQATYHSDIDNVEIYNPGSTALYVGRYDAEGAGVRIRGLRVTGAARSGFRAEQGLVIITCDVLVEGMTIKTTGATVVPLYISSNGGVARLGATIYDLNIQTPTTNLPGGIVTQIHQYNRVDIDFMNGVGSNRKLKLTDANDVQIGYLVSDSSTNVVSQLFTRDLRSYLRVGNAVNGRLIYPPRQSSASAHTRVPMPTNVIDARDFGVIPDDGLDDTAALQAAIDSLPRGDGIPGGSQIVGGIVQLPLGAINTAQSIKLPANVWLRGHGNGTVIRNMSLGPNRAVIELTSPYAHRSNIGASLDQLGIYSVWAAGVGTDSTLSGELKDFRMVGVRMSTGGPSIDLRNVRVNYGLFDRIQFASPGTMAFWLGKPDNSSVGNVVRAARTLGAARVGFQTEKAMFVFMGDTKIEGGSLEDVWGPFTTGEIRAFHASGQIRMDGMFMEFPRSPDGVGFMFENARGEIDRLDYVTPWRRVHLTNGSDISMRHLGIVGVTSFLRETISVDATSKLTLNTVFGQWDSGTLDHPRVIVRGFFNRNAGAFVETAQLNGPTLLKDPAITSISDVYGTETDWQLIWGNGYMGQLGTYTVENYFGQPRLRVTLTQPGYFHLRIKLDVPQSVVGRYGVTRWRFDGPTQAFAYTYANANQYLVRAMNSMTGGRTPVPLQQGDQLWINVGGPGASNVPAGTYYFWKLNVAAI